MSCQFITRPYMSNCVFGTLLKATSAVFWRCPGLSPYDQNNSFWISWSEVIQTLGVPTGLCLFRWVFQRNLVSFHCLRSRTVGLSKTKLPLTSTKGLLEQVSTSPVTQAAEPSMTGSCFWNVKSHFRTRTWVQKSPLHFQRRLRQHKLKLVVW